jgi:hypothetical protein
MLALLAGTAALLLRLRMRLDSAYLLVIAAVMLAGVVYEGGDAFGHARFIAPLLPLLYLGGIAGGAVVLKRLALPPLPSAALATAVLTLGALSLLRASLDPSIAVEKRLQDDGKNVSVWLSENAPEDYTVGAFAVGIVGYYSDRDILDLLGLNDVETAHTHVEGLGEGLAGHEKTNPGYVLEEARPELILISLGEPSRRTEEAIRQELSGLPATDPRSSLYRDERLWDQYDVRAVQIGNRWFHFLQRSDTVAAWQAPGLY